MNLFAGKLMRIVPAVVSLSPLLLGPFPCAFGQNAPRWELGPSISMIKLRELDSNRGFGFGARAVWNISEWLGTELQAARIRESTTHYQSTANVKGTWRLENSLRVNPFALAGIGGRRDTSLVPYPALGFLGPPQNSVALRFGGGIEIVPHKRLSIRLDASNLASRVPSASGSRGSFAPARWWNRLDVSLSTMVRFGSVGSTGR
jgi:hypothetical protein